MRKAIAVLVILAIAIVGSGCVTSAKNTYRNLVATEEPSVQPGPVEEIEIPEPVLTTVPLYQEPEELRMYRTNGKWLGEYFSWLRYNVSMQKDLRVRTRVYDFQILYALTEWSYKWGRYFTVYPEAGKKYLIIMPSMEMVGDSPEWDPRMWGMGQDHWYIQDKGALISPDPAYVPCTRIRELEETWDATNSTRIQSYGYDWQGGNETCNDLSWLRMGYSNQWSGFIVYQVPMDAWPKDLIVIGQFDGFGQAWWKLQERP